jgi:Flp pilus assembly protein TadD
MALSLRALDVDGSASERTARLTDCARREPRNAFVHHHLGLALRERRGEEMSLVARSQALVELAMARDLAPGFAMFRQGLAHALAEGGALPAALHEMEEAVRLEGANAGYHSDRGNILALMGRTREAVVAYCKAGALDPTTLLYEENLRALERKELRALPCPGTEEAP